MTRRAAIYARYSTELQSQASIEDQIRICTAQLERDGWLIAGTYSDYAISGATTLRPGFQDLLRDARAHRFDMVIAESLDRFSRDQEHIAGFYKLMSFAGISVITLADGVITELHVGLKGTMSALYLRDLALKTHRGIEGRVRAGHSGGGLSFGYHVTRKLGADGTPAAGDMEIVEREAEVIRQIFTEYVSGRSPRSIAIALNTAGVSGPRGGKWSASLILGNAVREIGVLRNRLYAGERVWNRQHFIKDPSTGKRVARPNPRDVWIISPAPQLRIVDNALWQAAQARLAAGRRIVVEPDPTTDNGVAGFMPNIGARLGSVRRPPWLLSGLVRCGVCLGPMGVVSSDGRLGCSNRRERGTCTSSRTISRGRLLSRVLVGLKERLLAPELVEEFVREFVTQVNSANRDRNQLQVRLGQERSKIGRQIRNLLEMIKEGYGTPALAQELRSLEQRQDAVVAEIAATTTPEAAPALHPNLPELYRRKVAALEDALRDPATAAAAAEALRSLIDAILVYPGEKRGQVHVELRGDLAAFLRLDEPAAPSDTKKAVPRSRNGRSGEVMGSLVAGGRNHRQLTRLVASC